MPTPTRGASVRDASANGATPGTYHIFPGLPRIILAIVLFLRKKEKN
jgi:hypothetical protein